MNVGNELRQLVCPVDFMQTNTDVFDKMAKYHDIFFKYYRKLC